MQINFYKTRGSSLNHHNPIKVGRPKSAEKRQQILAAASQLFLSNGYSGCSMEMVSKASDVSKQTVYSHFSNKEALFLAVIEQKCNEYQLDNRHIEVENSELVDVLRERGLLLIKLLHDEQVIAIYRVVIGEVKSNPRAAELFYLGGPKHNLDYLAKCFIKFAKQPISEEMAHKCAVTFFSLLKSEFHTKSILGLDFALSESEQVKQVEFAIQQVEIFLEQMLA